MEPYVTILPSTYDELGLDFEWYERVRLALIESILPEGSKVVDVGTRHGQTLIQLADSIASGVGIDLDGQILSAATRRTHQLGIENLCFILGDALALPLPPGYCDAVLLLGDVLSYANLFSKAQQVIGEARRVLRPDGIITIDGTNWPWEYAQSPAYHAFVQEADGGYAFCSVARTADGFETSQEWKVLPGTPLHDWLLSQRWPVSKEGYHTTLQVRVLAPFPPDWLGPLTTTCYQYFTPQTITRALQVNGFENAAVVPYGLTYDVTSRAGLSEAIRQHMPVLARAEAELARKTHSGAGPWLFAWATKPIE